MDGDSLLLCSIDWTSSLLSIGIYCFVAGGTLRLCSITKHGRVIGRSVPVA